MRREEKKRGKVEKGRDGAYFKQISDKELLRPKLFLQPVGSFTLFVSKLLCPTNHRAQ